MSAFEWEILHFCSNRTEWDGVFANLDTLDVSQPNCSRAFGARADVMRYVDGGAH